MVMTQSSSLTRVSTLIAKINQEKENTVRQRLKEWYKEGKAKARKGNKRVSLEVTECFASLLKWVLDLLPQDNQELPIALDATNNDQLKNISQIEHSRHRSPVNFCVNVLCGLIAYCHQPKKPSLRLDWLLPQSA